jgi:hypothetical protein
MPALFLGHGSPMNVLEDNVYTRAWRNWKTLPRPKAIVVVSAHWFTRGTGVTAMEAPKTIHDFGGFRRRCMTPITRHQARLNWRSTWLICWRLFPSRWIKRRGVLTTAPGAC